MTARTVSEASDLYREDLSEYSEDEIADLIASGVLLKFPDGRFQFRFVGAIAFRRRVLYVVPKFDRDNSVANGLFYVRVIQRYLADTNRETTNPQLDNIPAVMQTFNELNQYFTKFGIFKERRLSEASNDKARVNWSKTVNRNDMVMAFVKIDGIEVEVPTIFYPDPVRQIRSEFIGDVGDLFKKVLTVLATFIGPILRIRHPLEIQGNYDHLSDLLNSISSRTDFYRRLLYRHISIESGSRRRVLKVLYEFLFSGNCDHLAKIVKTSFTFGVTKFDRIWEDACVSTIADRPKSPLLAQPVLFKAGEKRRIGKQIIDGIIWDSPKRMIIVDAKNFDPSGLGTQDVMKQFAYHLSARRDEVDHVGNAMLFPHFDGQTEPVRYGAIKLEFDESEIPAAGEIALIQLDAGAILRSYVSRTKASDLRSVIVQFTFDGDTTLGHVSSKKFNLRHRNRLTLYENEAGKTKIAAGSKYKIWNTNKSINPGRAAALARILNDHAWEAFWLPTRQSNTIVKVDGVYGIFLEDYEIPCQQFANLLDSDYATFIYDDEKEWNPTQDLESIVKDEALSTIQKADPPSIQIPIGSVGAHPKISLNNSRNQDRRRQTHRPWTSG